MVALLKQALVVLVGLSFLSVLVPGVEAGHQVEERRYVGGGAISNVFFGMCGDIFPVQMGIGAACNIPCPHGTCDMNVIDDVNGEIIYWYQLDNDGLWRFGRGPENRDATTVTIMTYAAQATAGTIIVA